MTFTYKIKEVGTEIIARDLYQIALCIVEEEVAVQGVSASYISVNLNSCKPRVNSSHRGHLVFM